MEEGVFSQGYGLPPLLVPPPLPPTPKWGQTCRRPLPSCHHKCHSSAPGASGCSSWGPQIKGLGYRLHHSPPSPRGCTAGCFPGGAGCPHAPSRGSAPALGRWRGAESVPAPPEMQPWRQLLPAPEHTRWEGFPPPPHLQHYLEFLNRPKGQTIFFFCL